MDKEYADTIKIDDLTRCRFCLHKWYEHPVLDKLYLGEIFMRMTKIEKSLHRGCTKCECRVKMEIWQDGKFEYNPAEWFE